MSISKIDEVIDERMDEYLCSNCSASFPCWIIIPCAENDPERNMGYRDSIKFVEPSFCPNCGVKA